MIDADDDDIIRELADEGYSGEEIIDYLRDEGYDEADIAEAMIETGYDWEDALVDAIHDQLIDLDDAAYYADLLGWSENEVYDAYYGYDEG